MTHPDDDHIRQLLDSAASSPAPDLPSDLAARVLADAAQISASRASAARQQAAQPASAPQRAPLRLGMLARFWSQIGGLPAGAALAGAACLGIGLGYLAPDSLPALGDLAPLAGLAAPDGDGLSELAALNALFFEG